MGDYVERGSGLLESSRLVHEQLTGQIIAAAIGVHKELGPGLLESAYSVEKLLPIHQAQLLTYLRLSKVRVGLLINFNVRVLRQGIIRRII